MERLTTMHGGMMVPRKACTFDRDGGADDCKECTEICEDEEGLCRTCILQECLTRLGAYEDTGLTPEQIMELKERDTEKSVCHYHEEEKFRAYCQTCKRYLGIDFKEGYRGPKNTFCPGCGQRVKWED